VYEFLVPKPLEEVVVQLPPELLKKSLKRKREFMENFFDEKKEIAMTDISDEEEEFTEQVWKVAKFTDRHIDVRTIHVIQLANRTLIFRY